MNKIKTFLIVLLVGGPMLLIGTQFSWAQMSSSDTVTGVAAEPENAVSTAAAVTPVLDASVSTTALTSVSPTTEINEWTFAITPYFWVADIGATVEYGRAGGAQQAEVEVGAEDYLGNLKMAFPVALEARIGNHWSIFSDFTYMRINDEEGKVKSVEFESGGRVPVSGSANAGTNTTMELTGWTFLGGYRLTASDKGSFEPTLGVRYFATEATTDWNLTGGINGPGVGQTFQQSGSMKASGELWDALVGFRGHIALGKGRLSIPYYFDIGAGDSDVTWQGMAGLAYTFSWGNINANYRYLEYQTSSPEFLKKLTFSGPVLGVSFQF